MIVPPTLPLPRCKQLDGSGLDTSGWDQLGKKRRRSEEQGVTKSDQDSPPVPIKSTYYRYKDNDMLEYSWLKAPESLEESLPADALRISDDQQYNQLVMEGVCDLDLLSEVFDAQQHNEDLERVANPFYMLIHQSSFRNTSAYDFACLDHVLQFSRLVPRRERQNVVDIYGSTEGFTEFLLWRDRNTERNSVINAIFPSYSLPYCGVATTTSAKLRLYRPVGDGGDPWDIKRLVNIDRFISNINGARRQNLVVGSAGSLYSHILFESRQDIRHWLVSQAVMSLKLLDRGGMFICRVFDTCSLFEAQIFYLLHCCFAEITLMKPNTSTPFDTDWPLIESGGVETVLRHLEAALKRFEQGEKITSLLDPDQMKELHGKGAFLEWLNEQNFRLLFAQRIARKSLQALAVLNDFDYFAKDQALVKHRLSERWHLPQ